MTKDYAITQTEVFKNLDGLSYDIDVDRNIGWLILDRPPYNVISYRARFQINAIIEAMSDDNDVRAIVIRGSNGVFSSGGDVKSFSKIERDGMSNLAWNIAAPTRSPKPVICAMEKYAMGVGFELAMSSDIRVATKNTLLALPEVSIGQIPGSGGSHRVARIVGLSRAADLMYLGRRISALEAMEWGLLNEVVEDAEDLQGTIYKMVETLNNQSPLALKTMKRVLSTTYETGLQVGIELEGQAYEKLRDSEDYKEGIAAFAEKRKAYYKGC